MTETTGAETMAVQQCDRDAALTAIRAARRETAHYDDDDISFGDADESVVVQTFARHRLAALRTGWRDDMEGAPYSTPVRVKVGNMTFIASLHPDVSMDEHGNECDQWQAVNEGEHPPCWSGGACWQSNEDEVTSLQPRAWQPLPAPLPEPTR